MRVSRKEKLLEAEWIQQERSLKKNFGSCIGKGTGGSSTSDCPCQFEEGNFLFADYVFL